MMNPKKMLFWVVLPALLVALFGGCNMFEGKDGDSAEPTRVLISYELLTPTAITPEEVDAIIQPLAYLGFDLSAVLEATRFSVNVYKVTYFTFYKGRPVKASGAVLIPDNQQAMPVLSMQHGTIFHDSEAPSNFKALVNGESGTVLDLALLYGACGYICSVPDYLGYGASKELLHPYHQAESLGQTCMDMMRAGVQLCGDLNIAYQSRFFICGYSEGGYAALALQKIIETRFADEFPITASSCGAGAYDLLATVRQYISSPVQIYPPISCMFFACYCQLYEAYRNPAEVFQTPFAERIQGGLYSGDYTFAEIFAQLTTDTASLFTPGFLEGFLGDGEAHLKSMFAANSLCEGWIPSAPTRLYHSTADEIVPYFNSENAENTFRLNGSSTVELRRLEGLNHVFATFPWLIETIEWFGSMN
jgi:pimeloyl-ACP methyl ester carboxylesterase